MTAIIQGPQERELAAGVESAGVESLEIRIGVIAGVGVGVSIAGSGINVAVSVGGDPEAAGA